MRTEYIADGVDQAPILFLSGVTKSDAAKLIDIFGPLASGERTSTVFPDPVRREPASALQLELIAAERDEGCTPGSRDQLLCIRRPSTWEEIVGLLAPFAVTRSATAHSHQYLSEHGPITWIVSTDSSW
jgi:hypothetical protein